MKVYFQLASGLLGSLLPSKVSRLQDFLSVYFVPDVVASIGRYYDELASSYPIPQSYLCKYSLAQLEESIALELWDASESYSDQDQRKVDGKRGIQASQGSQDGEDSRGDKVGRGRGRGARRGRGGRESQSRRWRTPLCPEGRHF